MAHLRDDIEAAKAAYEEDVKTQNVEIANLKDCLLEVQTYIFRFLNRSHISDDFFFFFFSNRQDELLKAKKSILSNWKMLGNMRVQGQ